MADAVGILGRQPRTGSRSAFRHALGSVRGARLGWWLTLPLLAVMAVVVLFPFGFLVFVSLTDWMPTRGSLVGLPDHGIRQLRQGPG